MDLYIRLSSVAQVEQFVETVKTLSGEFELHAGRKILDARSIMGIFTLDLSQPLLLRVTNDTEANLRMLDDYMLE